MYTEKSSKNSNREFKVRIYLFNDFKFNSFYVHKTIMENIEKKSIVMCNIDFLSKLLIFLFYQL